MVSHPDDLLSVNPHLDILFPVPCFAPQYPLKQGAVNVDYFELHFTQKRRCPGMGALQLTSSLQHPTIRSTLQVRRGSRVSEQLVRSPSLLG